MFNVKLDYNKSQTNMNCMESRVQQYKEYLRNDNGKLVSRIKRPIILDNVSPNEIYITRRTPLCVYYKRAITLLRQQLVCYLCQMDAANCEKIGVCHNEELYELMQDRNCNLKGLLRGDASWGTRGIRIHAAGACIKSAFYLLQDILQHYYQQLQSQQEISLSQKSKKKSERFVQAPTLCDGDFGSTEKNISNFLNIKITSNSLICTDDLYINTDSVNDVSNTSNGMNDIDATIEVRRN